MPYISVNLGQKLEAAQKEKLKAELGRLITIIPGKTEPDLIVHIQDGGAMYTGGKEIPCAYIDLRVYTKTTGEAKKRFTRETCAYISREFAIPPERQYLTISEYEQWGYDGEWHGEGTV
jgi:phenylpyruvate tautomerase PptA (4-oxalocrotonate tautomerase family)